LRNGEPMKYDMRHTIILQNKTSTQNALGNRDESFVNVAVFKAAYIPRSGMMFVGGTMVHTDLQCEFRLRYSSIPQPDMYVYHDSIRYLIVSIIDIGGLHREMSIMCERIK